MAVNVYGNYFAPQIDASTATGNNNGMLQARTVYSAGGGTSNWCAFVEYGNEIAIPVCPIGFTNGNNLFDTCYLFNDGYNFYDSSKNIYVGSGNINSNLYIRPGIVVAKAGINNEDGAFWSTSARAIGGNICNEITSIKDNGNLVLVHVLCTVQVVNGITSSATAYSNAIQGTAADSSTIDIQIPVVVDSGTPDIFVKNQYDNNWYFNQSTAFGHYLYEHQNAGTDDALFYKYNLFNPNKTSWTGIASNIGNVATNSYMIGYGGTVIPLNNSTFSSIGSFYIKIVTKYTFIKTSNGTSTIITSGIFANQSSSNPFVTLTEYWGPFVKVYIPDTVNLLTNETLVDQLKLGTSTLYYPCLPLASAQKLIYDASILPTIEYQRQATTKFPIISHSTFDVSVSGSTDSLFSLSYKLDDASGSTADYYKTIKVDGSTMVITGITESDIDASRGLNIHSYTYAADF